MLLDENAPAGLGRTPWDAPHPVVLDMTAATDLGYEPVGDFATTVARSIDELAEAYRSDDPRSILPSADDGYFHGFFDYAAEDAYLESPAP